MLLVSQIACLNSLPSGWNWLGLINISQTHSLYFDSSGDIFGDFPRIGKQIFDTWDAFSCPMRWGVYTNRPILRSQLHSKFCYQSLKKVQEGSRSFNQFQEGWRRFKKVQFSWRRLKKVQECSRRFKQVEEGSIIKGAIGFHKFLKGSWRFKRVQEDWIVCSLNVAASES